MADEREAGAVVRSYYDYVDAEAYDELFSLFAEDILYHRPGHDPIVGKADFERFYREVRDLDGEHELFDVAVDGNIVAVRGTFRGTKADDAIETEFADFFTFDEAGDIIERHTYLDHGNI